MKFLSISFWSHINQIFKIYTSSKSSCLYSPFGRSLALTRYPHLKMFTIQDSELCEKIETLNRDLKQGNIQGSYAVAYNTLQIWRKIIAQLRWKNAGELIGIIRQQGMKLHDAQPCETCIGNMTGRVLKIIREECQRLSKEGNPTEGDHEDSLQKLMLSEGSSVDYTKQELPNLKVSLIESVNELITELETSTDNISAQALEHIHANEIILTAGKSRTVEAFLKKAAKKRKFQVIVVECAPFYHGHELAESLAKAGVETSVITDSAVFAMMSRVNKVIIGTHTVMANGGLKSICGSHDIALAARFYSVPFVVCAAMFKLSPKFLCPHDQDGFNKFVSPQSVLPFTEGDVASSVQIYNPVFDYVPPELVTLFISNIGGNAPSYVYRLVQELYSPEDNEFL